VETIRIARDTGYPPASPTAPAKTEDTFIADLVVATGAGQIKTGALAHSVIAMIGVLAAIREPERFEKLILVGPSPRYVDDGDYVGGSLERTSTSCSTRSRAITSAGRVRWRR
jgi:pimeloyl-ACP methyl ester carboxylesterase